MAVARTGVIFTAKKLRSKQTTAPGFFGKIKKPKSLFGWLRLILEIIGRPFFWLLLFLSYLLLPLLSLIGRLILLLIKQVIKLPRLIKPLAKKLAQYFLRLKAILKPPKIRLPKIRIPRLYLPKPSKKWLVPIGVTGFIVFTGLLFYWYVIKDLPHPDRLITREQIVSTKIYDRHGELLYKIYRNQNRTLVPLNDIPLSLIQATIAIEDAEFYRHYGFSFKGIIRSFWANLHSKKLYGGSTITQQLVKNALLTPERTLRRKIKEIILSLWVEAQFSKDEILQMYFNDVGYGGAAYGAEEAAQMYFGKSVKELDLAESALLAGLPASPTTSSPFGAHPELAKSRQLTVLKRMRQEGFITEDEFEQAREQELKFAPQRTDIKAPHFVMYVKELLVEQYGLRQVEEGGLEVTTSLDLGIQNEVQEIVRNEVEKLWRLHITNGAAMVTNPQTGEILAMVGSRDYFDIENDGNVNVTLSSRQPGSAIKPVNYSIALENGFTPATIISDTPITYQIPGQPPYSPKNYDNRFHGNIPLRIALASSYNVPAVKVLSAFGVERMVERGQEMGITTWDDPSRFGLSLTLGGGEVKMIDMAVVYGTLANMGMRADLQPILGVKNYKGEVLKKNGCGWALGSESKMGCESEKERVLSPNIAYLLTDILSDNIARTPAFGANSILNIPDHPHVAVKTGTTQNMRDNWTIGYTPDYLVAVWVGNNDNTPMSYVASGITGASPIWNQIMSYLIKDIPDKEFSKPGDLLQVEICPLTGTLPCEGCGGKQELFLPGTEPKTHCDPEKIKEIKEKQSQTPTQPE
ncbi:PBP1A family penicillin-binding protein [Patescibacteria group bacterium]|nr:PBP1A family penicillin-binding protein [Patescibacteria group bacterium]